MNSKMMFSDNQISPKKRKTSPASSPSDGAIFDVGVISDAKQANDDEEGKISVAFEAGSSINLYVGAIQKPVVGHGAGRGRGCSSSGAGSSQQRPVAFGGAYVRGPVGLQYLARSSSHENFQKPLSTVTIQKPYFFVSHARFLCCKNFEPGDDIFMFQDEYAFCTLDCRKLQVEFFEKRDNADL